MIKELTKLRYDVDLADEPDIDVLLDKQANDYMSAREAAARLNELEAENKRLREALKEEEKHWFRERARWGAEQVGYRVAKIHLDNIYAALSSPRAVGVDL